MARKKTRTQRIQDPATYFEVLEHYSDELRTRQYRYLRFLRKAINELINDLGRAKCILPPDPFPDRKAWVKKFALKLWQQDAGLVKDKPLYKRLGLKSDITAMSTTRQDNTSTQHVPPDQQFVHSKLPARYDTLSSFYSHLYLQDAQAPIIDTPMPQRRYAYEDYTAPKNQEHYDSLEGQQFFTLLSASRDRKRKINPEDEAWPMYTPRKSSKLEAMCDIELYDHKLAAHQQKDAAQKLWEGAVIEEEMIQQEMNVRRSRTQEGGYFTDSLALRSDYTATQGNIEELEDDIL